VSSLRDAATRRLEQALRETGAADPRERFREMLRVLREKDAEAFRSATRHFEDSVIPAVAAEGGDPLGEWLEFGRLLAGLTAEGETVLIDSTGRSRPYTRPFTREEMVLHLPKSPRTPAIAVGLPPHLSDAQKAAYALLVQESVRLP
jgi:hypothetical protein